MHHRLLCAAVLFWSPLALAQEQAPTQDTSTFDPDTKPDAPTPELPNPAEDTRNYAGVGSNIAYSEKGVGEFGGAATFSLSNGVVAFAADPSLGYFLWDNLEGSLIVGYRHLSLDGAHSNRFSIMLEPSLHVPINDGVFWALGLGNGVAIGDDVDDQPDLDAGYILAPRAGIQLMVGRSGLVNLGARYSVIFTDLAGDVAPSNGVAVLAFANTFDIQAGYTVMF